MSQEDKKILLSTPEMARVSNALASIVRHSLRPFPSVPFLSRFVSSVLSLSGFPSFRLSVLPSSADVTLYGSISCCTVPHSISEISSTTSLSNMANPFTKEGNIQYRRNLQASLPRIYATSLSPQTLSSPQSILDTPNDCLLEPLSPLTSAFHTPHPEFQSIVDDATTSGKPTHIYDAERHDNQEVEWNGGLTTEPKYTKNGCLSSGNLVSLVDKLHKVASYTEESQNDVLLQSANNHQATQYRHQAACQDDWPSGRTMAPTFGTSSTLAPHHKEETAGGIAPGQAQVSTSQIPETLFSSIVNNGHLTINHVSYNYGPAVNHPFAPHSNSANAPFYGPAHGFAMTCPDGNSVVSEPTSRAQSLSGPRPTILLSSDDGGVSVGENGSTLGPQRASKLVKAGKAIKKFAIGNGFTREVCVRSNGLWWQSAEMLLDTGSDVNIVAMSLVRELSLTGQINENDRIDCISMSDNQIEIVGSITLMWMWNWTRGAKEYETSFYVAAEANKAVDQLILGAKSIHTYQILKQRAFGARIGGRRIILPPTSTAQTYSNVASVAQHEQMKNESEKRMLENMRLKDEARRAAQHRSQR